MRALAAALQREPPRMAKGRLAAPSISASRCMAASPGAVSTGVAGRAAGASALAISMSSGNDTTTGPGRPEVATAKARVTSSGTRAGSSISTTHLAMSPKKRR